MHKKFHLRKEIAAASLSICLFFCGVSLADEQYTLSNSWEHARERLALLEEWSNPHTFETLEKVGIQRSWHCLDAGAGLGGVTRWIAKKVGTTGSVDALDMNPHFLKEITDTNVRILQQNLVTDDLPEATYDFIFARNLLMHIPEREYVIQKFVGALKPGGVLMTEDLGRLPSSITHIELSKDSAVNAMAIDTLDALEKDGNMSFLSSHKGPMYYQKAGLIDITGSTSASFAPKGIEGKVISMSYKQLKPLFMKKGFDEAVYDRLIKSYEHNSAWWWGSARVTTIGYKPL